MGGTVVTLSSRGGLDTRSAGVGLRLPHLAEVAAGASGAAWLEVHPENFVANPHARELLLEVARFHRLSLHSVGVSVGSATGIDRRHLARVRQLADDVDALCVSGHLAWSTHAGAFLNDLLPLPYDDESLSVVATHVDEVQEALRRPYLLENPASYVGFATSSLAETDFLTALTIRTGCRLLCDVSNVVVSSVNLGFDAAAYIDALPADAVAQLHLGGYTRESDDATPGGEILIDTHSSAIANAAWELYAHALRRFGPKPTLIEWDNQLPDFALLLEEARRADVTAVAALRGAPAHALAR
jgi:uncharacterized protein (UPF0276 family)